MVHDLLSKLQIYPVLVDVGASGHPPLIWEPIKHDAVYVGFDPDQRDLQTNPVNGYFKAHIVNTAITASDSLDQVEFYLTHSPHCSSTLPPDLTSLENYLFAPLFAVEGKSKVSATTLNDVSKRLALSSIDWLKVDTQGTDLRIYQSLAPQLKSSLVALDVEPGLIDAYQGEDLFTDTHKTLTDDGFWLSDLAVKGTVRMRLDTISGLQHGSAEQTKFQFEHRTKISPGWVEARYLRTLEYAVAQKWSEREYILLWAFALLDSQFGFALDTAAKFKSLFGNTSTAREIETVAWSIAMRGSKRWLITKRIKRIVKRLIGYQS